MKNDKNQCNFYVKCSTKFNEILSNTQQFTQHSVDKLIIEDRNNILLTNSVFQYCGGFMAEGLM